jgi:hypothetical protein
MLPLSPGERVERACLGPWPKRAKPRVCGVPSQWCRTTCNASSWVPQGADSLSKIIITQPWFLGILAANHCQAAVRPCLSEKEGTSKTTTSRKERGKERSLP